MRNNRKKAYAVLFTLLFGTPIVTSCSPTTSTSIAPHECVFYDVEAVTPTCLHEGHIAYKQCPYCGKIEVNGEVKTKEEVTLPIDPDNHEDLVSYDEVPATCIQDGTKAYQFCNACGSYVIDGENYTEETLGDHLVLHKEDAAHLVKHIGEVPPSCIDGMKEHDICMRCGKYFVDGKEVDKESLILPATGEHIFDDYGVCVNGCGTYKVEDTVMDENNLVEVTSAHDPYAFSFSDKVAYGEYLKEKRMSFATQAGSSSAISYTSDGITITTTAADNNFTRFAPGVDGKAYVGAFLLTFDVRVGSDTVVNRLGARITNSSGDMDSSTEADQDLLIGVSGSGSENNPDRVLEGNVLYRFVYRMETKSEDDIVQLWTCLGSEGLLAIDNIHFAPLSTKEDKVSSTLLYFGKTDMKRDESGIQVASITLDKTSLSLVKGSQEQLTATVLPEDAKDKTVTWSSKDPTIADVDKTGLVSALGVGKTEITATAGDFFATCTVTVTESAIAVTGVTLDKKELHFTLGDEGEKLTATVLPEDATDKSLTWETNDPEVATVEDGFVTPKKAGEAIITVKTVDGNFTDTCTVTVEEAPVVEETKPYYLYNGLDFFAPESWYDSSNNKRDDSLLNANKGLHFTSATSSRIDLFQVFQDGGSWIHLADKAEKWSSEKQSEYFGKTFTFDMTISASDSFDMLLFGNSKAVSNTTNGQYAFWVRFEEGKITFHCDDNNESNRADFVAESDLFAFGKENELSIQVSRVDGDTLTVELLVNGKTIPFADGKSGAYYSMKDGIMTSDTFLATIGMGQRFGIFPSDKSSVDINRLAITPEPDQKDDTEEVVEDELPTKPCTMYNGNEFFDPSSWRGEDKNTARGDEILDKDGNLVFTDSTASRVPLFNLDVKRPKDDGSTHQGENATNLVNKDQTPWDAPFYDVVYTYDMAISATGSFAMEVLGNSNAYGPSDTGLAALYLHFDTDGTISLSQTSGNKASQFTKAFSGASSFSFEKVNHVALEINRVDASTLTLSVIVNGEKVKLQGEAQTNGNFSVDETGTFVSANYLSSTGMGGYFGIYPDSGSTVTLSGFGLDPLSTPTK